MFLGWKAARKTPPARLTQPPEVRKHPGLLRDKPEFAKTGGEPMTLQESLQKFKEGVLAQLSTADVALMDKATEDLVRSGIVERAPKAGDH